MSSGSGTTGGPEGSAPKRTQSVLDLVGNTPIVRIRALARDLPPSVRVYAKLEGFNPGGSVKDRPALNMIRDGLKKGRLRPGKTILDSTSGNTGIALAMIGAALGYPVELVMPENVSIERKKIIRAYGAKHHLLERARGLRRRDPPLSRGAEERPGEVLQARSVLQRGEPGGALPRRRAPRSGARPTARSRIS